MRLRESATTPFLLEPIKEIDNKENWNRADGEEGSDDYCREYEVS
jgi:hypothetical protein